MSEKQYRELCRRARKMGHELTPELRGELRILAAVPDEVFGKALRKAVVKDMASTFKVPVPVAERRLKGFGPFSEWDD
jgi:hypothetical protein